jgi:biopolymer transport protein ExbD
MAEINMVPLIDVMLVLLVIFIITAPLLTQAVKLELPKASSQVNDLKPDKVDFAIDAQGVLYWNGEKLSRADAATPLPRRGGQSPSSPRFTCAPTRASRIASSRRPWPMRRRPG